MTRQCLDLTFHNYRNNHMVEIVMVGEIVSFRRMRIYCFISVYWSSV